MSQIFLDPEGILLFWNKVKERLNEKVDKVTGKGLSTNDYTNEEKTKLQGIETSAQVNVNADWNANSGDAQILNKPYIPQTTSDITNNSGYITITDVTNKATNTTPKMDGTATIGSETTYARGDHIHPSDITKVDKEAGMGLSANDFTTILKTKLEGISPGADVSVQSDWNASTGKAAILNKPVIPTTTNELTNNSGFVTYQEVEGAINNIVNQLTAVQYIVVDELPVSGEVGFVYLIPHEHGENDVYDEYIYYDGEFEKLGNTDIDLSGYALTSTVNQIAASIPTNNNQLINGAGYQTSAQVTSAINASMSPITTQDIDDMFTELHLPYSEEIAY